MKKIYHVLNAEDQIIWKVFANDLKEAALKVKEKLGDDSLFLRIE